MGRQLKKKTKETKEKHEQPQKKKSNKERNDEEMGSSERDDDTQRVGTGHDEPSAKKRRGRPPKTNKKGNKRVIPVESDDDEETDGERPPKRKRAGDEQPKKKTNEERNEEMGSSEQGDTQRVGHNEPPAKKTRDPPPKKTNKERNKNVSGVIRVESDGEERDGERSQRNDEQPQKKWAAVNQVERDEETDEEPPTRGKRFRLRNDKEPDDKRLQKEKTKTNRGRNDNKGMSNGVALSRSDQCLAIFLDVGTSNTVGATVEGNGDIRHMENWGHGFPQREIPTLVVVSRDEDGQLRREFGLNARFARGTAVAIFDHLKWNMLPSSSHLEKQQEDEKTTECYENMKFYIQSTLKAIMDDAIHPGNPPEEVLLYLTYPVEWDAVTVNKYCSYAEVPSEWRGKFKFKIIPYNEATAASVGKSSTMSRATIEKYGLLEGGNFIVVDIGKGTIVRFPDRSTVHYLNHQIGPDCSLKRRASMEVQGPPWQTAWCWFD